MAIDYNDYENLYKELKALEDAWTETMNDLLIMI